MEQPGRTIYWYFPFVVSATGLGLTGLTPLAYAVRQSDGALVVNGATALPVDAVNLPGLYYASYETSDGNDSDYLARARTSDTTVSQRDVFALQQVKGWLDRIDEPISDPKTLAPGALTAGALDPTASDELVQAFLDSLINGGTIQEALEAVFTRAATADLDQHDTDIKARLNFIDASIAANEVTLADDSVNADSISNSGAAKIAAAFANLGAAAIPDLPVLGDTITLYRDATNEGTLTGLALSENRDDLLLTIKRVSQRDDGTEDSEAILQISENDGLRVFYGAAGVEEYATLVGNTNGGTASYRIDPLAGIDLVKASGLVYDVKEIIGGDAYFRQVGTVNIKASVTRTISS